LRRRVTVSVLVVLAVVLFGVVLTVDALFPVYARKDLNALLTSHLAQAQLLAKTNASPTELIRRQDVQGVRARVVLPDGEQFGTLSTGVTDTSSTMTRTAVLGGTGRLAGARLTLSADTSTVTAAQQRLREILLLTALGAVALTAVVMIVTVRFALSPLAAMARLARSIAGGDRGWRLAPTRTDTELGRTAVAFDDMLDALEGAERQARAAEVAARAAAERTRQFVADAAHELRTPITGVQAVAEAVLQQGADADPAERERLHLLLVRESRRASQLVDDLLDLARIDAGPELQYGPVDLRALADTEAARAGLLAPELTVDVVGPALVVTADNARVTQILANLMDNARQATGGKGTITVRIDNRTEAARSYAEIVVSDDGPGVPVPDRERIFDRLVRLDDARDRRSGGSGLGLAIARGFARAHGGDLTCAAPPPGHRGAVFRLLLPVADGPSIFAQPTVASPTVPISHP
jgi:signal transduction histidine kinase